VGGGRGMGGGGFGYEQQAADSFPASWALF